MAKKIDVGGELNSTALDKKLVDAAQVKDSSRGEKTLVETNEEIEYLLAQEGERQKQFEANEAARQAEADKTEQDRADEAARTEAERQATFEANEAERQVLYEKVENNTEGIEFLNANTGVSEYPEFSEAKAYAAGDVVRYEGLLKRFISAHEPGAWDGSQVEDWSERKEVDGKVAELGTQVIYDVSANNDGATFASLSALLSSENLSTLIPTAVRCGGMSIRFVQSSDNKYIRYNLLADSFTTDTTQWAIAEEGVYVENPEFIYVKTDAEDKILWAIKTDGSIYYGAGCPQQVIDYIDEKVREIPSESVLDIINFIGEYLGNTTLEELLSKKLDVEYVENPEYIEVKLDAEGRILEATHRDGTKLLPAGVKVNGAINHDGAIIENKSNFEYLESKIDANGRIIEAIRTDGTKETFVNAIFKHINAKQLFIDEKINLLKNSRNNFVKDFLDNEYVIQNLPELARFNVDDVIKDYSEDVVDLNPLTTNLLTVLYEKMDALMEEYPEFITKVDAFDYVRSEMNALGVDDYPWYAKGIQEKIEVDYTYPDGEKTKFTYDITPAYRTYMYIVDFGSMWWGSNDFNKHKKVFLVGGTHGSERQSEINLYLFAKELCKGTTDKNYFAMRNSCQFFIVPMLSGYSVMHGLRTNANGININRNFPCKNGFVVGHDGLKDSEGHYYNFSGTAPYSEFETKLIKCLTEKILPDVAIDHHSYGMEMPCQIYYDVIPSKPTARCLYQAAIDISHALQKKYPENFGNDGKILISSNSYLPARDGENSQTMGVWFCNIKDIRFSGTVEISHYLNYENGVPTSQRPVAYDEEYRNKVFGVGEYTLRVSLIRMLERFFTISN